MSDNQQSKVSINSWVTDSDYQNNSIDRKRFQSWLYELWESKNKKIIKIQQNHISIKNHSFS